MSKTKVVTHLSISFISEVDAEDDLTAITLTEEYLQDNLCMVTENDGISVASQTLVSMNSKVLRK